LKEETTGFDHGQRSKFMLRPYHQGLACQKCHPDGSTFKGLRADCASCHVSDWAPAPGFDHARTGVITLNDKHKDADCSGCHPDGMGKPTKCNACHDGEWKYPDKLPGERIAPAQPAALAAK
jgi:hypothetical protein